MEIREIAVTLQNEPPKRQMTMTTMELKHTLNEELKAIEGSDELMKAAIRLLRKLRKDAETREQRHARERQEMLDELREAFRELDEIKAGKRKAMTYEEFKLALKEEEVPV